MTERAAEGLRERSKTRRRRHILHSALRLFAEHGYDQTTIHDIAAAADVAPRTVTGYFPAKLDFVTEWPTARAERLIALYGEHPDVGFLDLVDRWWREARATIDPEEARLTRAMAEANPGIAAMAEAEAAGRTSRADLPAAAPAERDPHHVVHGAGRAAVQGINQAFFRGIADGEMSDEVHQALLDLMRGVVQATGVGHGALAPDR